MTWTWHNVFNGWKLFKLFLPVVCPALMIMESVMYAQGKGMDRSRWMTGGWALDLDGWSTYQNIFDGGTTWAHYLSSLTELRVCLWISYIQPYSKCKAVTQCTRLPRYTTKGLTSNKKRKELRLLLDTFWLSAYNRFLWLTTTDRQTKIVVIIIVVIQHDLLLYYCYYNELTPTWCTCIQLYIFYSVILSNKL